MGARLPEIDRDEFEARLRPWVSADLGREVVDRLFLHYRELRIWNERLSLVGPGTAGEAVERHYGESLAALALLPRGPLRLVDLGSGAGFPGWVLAAARPDLRTTLVESQERKWSFLTLTAQRASLPCEVVNARVGATLPGGFPDEIDRLMVRAVKLSHRQLSALAARMAPEGRFLFWVGGKPLDLPEGWARERALRLAAGERRILEVRPNRAEDP
jgi:16S rRNA (guanine527-N7)-methyltransferase